MTGAPILFRAPGMAVIMKGSMRHMDVIGGDNVLDKVRTFTCKSAAGCIVITSASTTRFQTLGTSTCSYVDDNAGTPGCAYDPITIGDNVTSVMQEQFAVSAGLHSVQTRVHSDNTLGQILGWEVNYTIYERRAP